jgi:tryptophanyl-tRNA synthetase
MEACGVCMGSGKLLETECPLCDGDPNFTKGSRRKVDNASGDGKVTAFDVEGAVDYDKLVKEFGCTRIDPDLIARFERITGRRAHLLLRRGIFYTHRDLSLLLDDYERGIPFYLYTGRGASSEALHVGHLVPFLFTKYLQEAFDVPLVIQLTDDEKFYYKDNLSLEEARRLAYLNAKDIIACGFNPDKTFIFTDTDYMGTMYPIVAKAAKLISFKQCHAVLGDNILANIGRIFYPGIQAAPAFPGSFPHMFGDRKDIRCLIPQAIDQDPFFRLCRDIAPRMGETKPACIHAKFFPAMEGPNSKMSSTVKSRHITIKVACDSAGAHGFSVDKELLIDEVRDKSLKKQQLGLYQKVIAVDGSPVSTLDEFKRCTEGMKQFAITVVPLPSTIFMTDQEKVIAYKVKHFAFSGGQDTKALHEKIGGNLDVDVSYQYLRHILEDDDYLDQIGEAFASGKMMSADMKRICTDELTRLVTDHQRRLANVTDDVVRHFMNPNRPSLQFFGKKDKA